MSNKIKSTKISIPNITEPFKLASANLLKNSNFQSGLNLQNKYSNLYVEGYSAGYTEQSSHNSNSKSVPPDRSGKQLVA